MGQSRSKSKPLVTAPVTYIPHDRLVITRAYARTCGVETSTSQLSQRRFPIRIGKVCCRAAGGRRRVDGGRPRRARAQLPLPSAAPPGASPPLPAAFRDMSLHRPARLRAPGAGRRATGDAGVSSGDGRGARAASVAEPREALPNRPYLTAARNWPAIDETPPSQRHRRASRDVTQAVRKRRAATWMASSPAPVDGHPGRGREGLLFRVGDPGRPAPPPGECFSNNRLKIQKSEGSSEAS